MVAFLAAAAGAAAVGTALSTYTQIKGNEDALDAQKEAMKLELRQAKQRAKIEDRQTVKSIELADRQTVARFSDSEAQAAVAAAEDREALKSELATQNLNAASRALEIRRSLSAVLGEQRATLAARGVGSGSLAGMFADDANAAATDDFNANTINKLQAGADEAAGQRAISTSLKNMRGTNQLTLSQQRERAAAELDMLRFSTKIDLKNQEEAAKLGFKNAQTQTRYANTAALISGFTQIASLGYSGYQQYKAIEPTRQPQAYAAPRPLIRGPSGMAAQV
jgi:hypothetical protein